MVGNKSKNHWFNERCHRSKQAFKRAHRRFKRTNSEVDRIYYVEERTKYARVIHEEKEVYFINFAKELNECKNSREFWSKVNHLKGEHAASEIGASLTALREHFKKELGTRSQSEDNESGGI